MGLSEVQSVRPRLRVLEAALHRIAQDGYEHATIARIADDVGVSVGDVCRHFPTKEHFAIALYDRLAGDLVEWAAEMPEGTVAARFVATMRRKLELMSPHRASLVALAGRAIDPSSRAHVFGRDLEVVRSKVSGVFRLVVLGATDAPALASGAADAARLARLLYGAHLAMVMLALQDASADFAAAKQALSVVEGAFGAMPIAVLAATIGAQIDAVVGTFLGTSRGASKEELARVVLDRIFRHRRVLPGVPAEPSEAACALHLPRIAGFIDAGEPIEIVLPAFPAKAPNPKKVLGKVPDSAEWAALESLAALLRDIGEAHPPGATLVICSDGHVFADAVNVSDDDVAAYRGALEKMIAELGAPNIRIFGLEDAYSASSHEESRRILIERYAVTVDAIRERAAGSPIHAAQLDGIHRFLFEDEIGGGSTLSRTQARKVTRERAYEVVRRSDAWGRLVEAMFPRAIRLSIHPQPDVSAKIGIPLVPSDDAWLTPWHGVLVVDGDRARLMRRSEAEELGAVVAADGRHMELS